MSDGIFKVGQAAKLDTPGRIEELRPAELLRDIAGVKAGDTGVDLGSGTGVFTIALAELAAGGTVYAVDNSDVMHGHLRDKNPPDNIVYITADVTATGLPDGTAGVCVAGFILHEIKDPGRLIAEARRLLEPGGTLVVVDWREDVEAFGPPRHKRISRERIRELCEEAGFTFSDYIDWTDNHFAALAVKTTTR